MEEALATASRPRQACLAQALISDGSRRVRLFFCTFRPLPFSLSAFFPSYASLSKMETTIPEPVSPPSASTSFTSEENEDDRNGGGKRDKALDLAFDLAASRVASFAASKKLADADALRLYGFYKQALEGDCTAARPAIWDRKGRAKW